MDWQRRPTLDNPAFKGRLRNDLYGHGYTRPSSRTPVRRIDDITISEPVRPRYEQSKSPIERVSPNRAAADTLHPRIKPSTVLRRDAVRPVQPPGAPATEVKPGLFSSRMMHAMAAVVFVVGLSVSLAGLRTNHKAQAQVDKITAKQSNNTAASSPPPSADKPSDSVVNSYTVAPDLPKYIDIPTLGVHARIFPVGTTKSGALATPNNVYNTAWYNQSAKPGQAGAMLIDGHISSWTTHGVFYGLKKLSAGDFITVTRGDNQKFTYKVVKSTITAADKLDMASLLVSADVSKPGLNLISCSGDVIPGTNEFDKRIAVFATE